LLTLFYHNDKLINNIISKKVTKQYFFKE